MPVDELVLVPLTYRVKIMATKTTTARINTWVNFTLILAKYHWVVLNNYRVRTIY